MAFTTRHVCLTIFWASSCATSALTGDLASLERTVGTRAELGAIALPRTEPTDATPEEVDQLLAHALTSDDAVRVALLNNREARAALADVGIARGVLVQAGLIPNPEVEFGARGPGGPQPAQLDFGLDLNLSATILAPLRAGVAEAALDAQRWRAAGLLLDLAYETRLAFLDVAAAQRRLELRQQATLSQEASYDTALELARVGNLPPIAVSLQLAAVEQARIQVSEAETALVDAREALTRKLGLAGSRVNWKLAAAPPLASTIPATESTEAQAIVASLELSELDSRAESARRKIGLTQAEAWLPHLTAGFHGERDGTLWELGGHVTVGLPVFDRAQGRNLSARSEYDGLRAMAQGQAVHVRSVVRATINRLATAGQRSKQYRERLLPAREEALKLTVHQYNAMQVGVFEVLAAQRAVTETSIAEVEVTLDAQRAQAALGLLLAGRSTPLRLGAVPHTSAPVTEMTGGH